MTQSQFQSDAKVAQSQTATILAELQKNQGEWVPMPHLALSAQCFSVRSRIDELRKRGHVIENRSERDRETRRVHSYYRILANHPSGFGAADAQLQGRDRDSANRQFLNAGPFGTAQNAAQFDADLADADE